MKEANWSGKLPNKQSELLRLAVNDAKKISKNPKYKLNMGTWHTGGKGKKAPCRVCLAGSVMACSLNTPYTTMVMPEDFDEHWKLEDINDMRMGYFFINGRYTPGDRSPEEKEACEKAGRLIHDKFNEKTGRAPWATYLKAANILEKAGL